MTNKNDKVYEEAEIVQEPRKNRGARYAQSGAEKYTHNSSEEMSRQLFWSSFGSIFITLFVLFVVVALVLTILFWLLPFAIAALVGTFLVGLVVAGYQAVRNFLQGK